MKHSGQIPQAVAGELLHIINNDLGAIMLHAAKMGGEHGEAIEKKVLEIGAYVRACATKSDWDSSRFDKPWLAEEKKAA